jgi:hypothetical protein
MSFGVKGLNRYFYKNLMILAWANNDNGGTKNLSAWYVIQELVTVFTSP